MEASKMASLSADSEMANRNGKDDRAMRLSAFVREAPKGERDEVEAIVADFDEDGDGNFSAEEVLGMIMAYKNTKKQSHRKSLWLVSAAVLVVLLALANIGTSFAAASLAKDSKVVNGVIVGKSDSRALSTLTAHSGFKADPATLQADFEAFEKNGGLDTFNFIGASIPCSEILTFITFGDVEQKYQASRTNGDYTYGYTVGSLNLVFSPVNIMKDESTKVYHANEWSGTGITDLNGIFVVCTDADTDAHPCPVCASGVKYLPNGSVIYNE